MSSVYAEKMQNIPEFFFGAPHLDTWIFLIFYCNEPELVARIYSGLALTPFPSSILDEILTHNLLIVSWVC